jgi:hypothetical protein
VSHSLVAFPAIEIVAKAAHSPAAPARDAIPAAAVGFVGWIRSPGSQPAMIRALDVLRRGGIALALFASVSFFAAAPQAEAAFEYQAYQYSGYAADYSYYAYQYEGYVDYSTYYYGYLYSYYGSYYSGIAYDYFADSYFYDASTYHYYAYYYFDYLYSLYGGTYTYYASLYNYYAYYYCYYAYVT